MFGKLFIIISLFASSLKSAENEDKPVILVSLAPYQEIVQKIAGNSYRVEVIVPEGTNPHAYEPTPRQVQAIANGTLWFQVGESFEKKLFLVLKEKNKAITAIDLREKISLIQGSCCSCDGSGEDRHIWLSPKALMNQVGIIQESLSKKFPKKGDLFEENALDLTHDLEDLDQKVRKTVAKAKSKSIVVAHPAFGYFCRDYGLNQLSIEEDGKEPTARHLSSLLESAKQAKATLAISMPEHPSKGVEIVSKKLNLRLCEVHPYSSKILKEMEKLSHLVAQDD